LSANTQFVTPNYFNTLGVRIRLGRGFDQRHFDELNPPELTAVLSDAFATVLFGEPRAAVGQKVKVNDVTVTIVGVAPRRFNGAVQSGQPKRIWLPLSSLQLVEKVDLAAYFDPGVEWFEAVARLQPGVDVSDAQSAIRAVAARFDLEAKARGQRTSTATADVVPLRGLIDAARYANERGPTAVIFSVLAALILLVCTTTVNSLLAGAAVARRYEIGVRLALGASRSRVVRQLLTEVSLLSIAGGLLGMWVFATLGRFTEVAKDGFDTSPNWATAAFTLAYAVIAATLAGLSPALHATRAGVSEVLKESSAAATRRTRLQRTFVIAQIAIAQPLMVTLAAATAHVFSRIPTLENVRLRERLLIAELDTQLRYTVNAPDRIPDLMRRLEAVPGVVSVLRVGNGWGESISLERPRETADDSTATSIRAAAFAVPPGYFEVVGAPIARGRGFVASDTTLAVRPVLINRLLAAQLFQSRDPIGQRIRQQTRGDLAPTELEVIGVVDMAQENNSFGYASDDPPIFVPLRRQQGGRILIRTSVPADSLVAAVRSAAKEEARLFPVARIGTLAQADRDRRDSRLQIFGTGAGCASIVLMLASIGLYAMMNIAVGQRRREIGIRVALGAHAHQVVALFFRNGLRVILLGLALGLPLSLAGLAFVTWKSGMPWLHVQRSAVVVTLAVVGVGALASWLPARRAASVNPTLALRSE
jgi:predicted permease